MHLGAPDQPKCPATTHIRCPTCRSSNIDLTEVGSVALTWRVEGGRFDRNEGYREYGEIHSVFGDCHKCGRHWRLRKVIQITDVCKEDDPTNPPALSE